MWLIIRSSGHTVSDGCMATAEVAEKADIYANKIIRW